MRKIGLFLTLSGIMVLALALRLEVFNNFNYYPDSYFYLLMAKSFNQFKAVSNQLPDLFYSPFLSDYTIVRVGYPLTVSVFSKIFIDLEKSAHIVSITFNLLSIPIVFLLAKKLFKSNLAAFSSVFLLSLSFTNILFSSSIMTESFATFLVFLLWYCALSSNKSYKVFPSGLIAVFLILTKIEYLLLIFPIAIFLIEGLRNRIVFILTSILGSLFFINILTRIDYSGFVSVIKDYWIFLFSFLLIFAMAFFFSKKPHNRIINTSLGLLILILSLAFSLETLLLGTDTFKTIITPFSLRFFIQNDFLIFSLGLAGLVLMFLKSHKMNHFFLTSFLPLLIIYILIVNPLHHRYMTILVPSFVLTGGYLILEAWTKFSKNMLARTTLLIIFFLLIFYQFTNDINTPSAFLSEESYGKRASAVVANILRQKNISPKFLVAKRGEPYAFYLNTPVITPQYVQKWSKPSENVYLIIDMSSSKNGNKEIKERLSTYNLLGSAYTGVTYWEDSISYKEEFPILIYQLPAEAIQRLSLE